MVKLFEISHCYDEVKYDAMIWKYDEITWKYDEISHNVNNYLQIQILNFQQKPAWSGTTRRGPARSGAVWHTPPRNSGAAPARLDEIISWKIYYIDGSFINQSIDQSMI